MMWNFFVFYDRTAVITENRLYSYEALDRMQKKFSDYLCPRSLVCLCIENNIGGLVAYLSCIQNGHVVLLLPAESKRKYVWKMAEKYQADYICYPSEPDVSFSAGDFSDYRKVADFFDYNLCRRKPEWKYGNKKELHRDLALLLHTSGSTGSYKVVRLSYENILANTKSICRYMNLSVDDRAVTSLSLSYTFGLSVVHTILWSGGCIYLTSESVVQASFWKHITQFDVTLLAGVPYTYECMKQLHISLEKYPSLRLLIQAGGRLSADLQCFFGKQAEKTGKEFLVMYGQTEATARISYLPAEDCLVKPGSVGIAIPDTEIYLVDTEGSRIESAFCEGEVVSKGRHVSMGYAENVGDLMEGDCRGGVLYTGDIGYMDKEGYLYLRGRKSRFAKLYGKRISLDDVERIVCNIVGETVAVVSDDKTLYVFSEIEVEPSKKRAVCLELSLQSGVVRFEQVKELGYGTNGKIDYKKLEARVELGKENNFL